MYFHLYFLFSVIKFVFWFSLVNFKRDTYLAVDHSLVYSYPKIFLLNVWLLGPGLQPSFSIHISVYFFALKYSYLLNGNPVINYPQLVNLVFRFLIHNECALRYNIICLYQWLQTLISLFTHVILYFWLYILSVLTQSRDSNSTNLSNEKCTRIVVLEQ